MIGVTALFLAFSGIAFLGYILTALFAKIKIANILPLMLLGLLVGPILHWINTGPGSTVVSISPYVSAIAIAFVLFDVGLSLDIKILGEVILKASKFTFELAMFTGIILSLVIFFIFRWNLYLAFIAGFALAGPSAIILPSATKITKINKRLRSALLFESVATDSVQLMIPILLFSMLTMGSLNLADNMRMFVNFFLISPVFGAILAFFWVFILEEFSQYSKRYSWMLTITMVIGSYGIAQALQLYGAVSVFVFGVVLVNIPKLSRYLEKYTYDIKKEFIHIRDYQREITFFVSTFFFFYIGLVFRVSELSNLLLVGSFILAIIIFLARYLFVPILNDLFSQRNLRSEKIFTTFDVARGLSPTIIATMPEALGMGVSGLTDLIFLTVIFTNIIMTAGLFIYAKRAFKK